MNIFVLHHTHDILEDEDDVKLIGVYSTEAAANQAIEELSGQPGFSAHPGGFEISEYELDVTHWREGFVTLTS